MNPNRGAIICLGYILGLTLTCLWGGINSAPTLFQWFAVGGAIAGLTGVGAWLLPRHFWQLKASFWLVVGLVALLAVGYFQIRTPQPQQSEIYQLTQEEPNLLKYPLQITGKIASLPQIKSDNKSRFWLESETVITKYQIFPTTGKLYGTLAEPKEPLKLGDKVTLQGRLYQPKPSSTPWSFDFAQYLQKHNTFLGFSSWEITDHEPADWNFGHIRERIVNVHQRFLGTDAGALLSSMVLGRQAVNLPEEVYDLWVQAGLAYTIAASGFHVSLLLGSIQWFTKKQTEKIQLISGIFILSFYVLLTGFQPSVLRAALMGAAGLVAIALDRKTKPLSLLILVATVLLLVNPLWIWDLSFQLSFLATFGLLTTLQPIEKKLDFLPPNIATIVAIPLAASLWTLPLIAYQFNVVATYSIFTSIILSPVITIVSLGGMISGAVGLVIPYLGSAIASLVGIPLQGMVWFVEWVVKLPGSSLSVAAIHWTQLCLFYGVMLFIWLNYWGKRHVKTLGISIVILFISFSVIKHWQTTQLTIFNTQNYPLVVAQSAGRTVVFNGGNNVDQQISLVSFLRKSGINTIDTFVSQQAEEISLEMNELDKNFVVKEKLFFSHQDNPNPQTPLAPLESKKFGKIQLQLMQLDPFLFAIQIDRQRFYILGDRRADSPPLPALDKGYLITNPNNLDLELWETLRPQGAIAIGSPQGHVLAPNPNLHWTERDGAIQWTPAHHLTTLAPEPF